MATDVQGHNLLHKAASGSSLQTFRQLVQTYLSPTRFFSLLAQRSLVEAEGGLTPLHLAILHADISFVDCMLGLLVDTAKSSDGKLDAATILNAKTTKHGYSALHLAIFAERSDVLALLLDRGAKPSVLDGQGQSPLGLATRQNNEAAISSLLHAQQQPSEQQEPLTETFSALHYACSRGNVKQVQRLLDSPLANELFTRCTPSGDTAAHLSAWFGQVECLNYLLAWGKEHDLVDALLVANREQATLVHLAAYGGHRACLEALHERAFSLTTTDGEKSTPLHKAASQGHAACVDFLLGIESVLESVDAGDAAGFTALHLAVLHGHVDIVRLLLTTGKASSAAKNAELFSPFHLSVLTGSVAIIGVFIKHGGEGLMSDTATEYLLSPLHLGCSSLNRDAYQLLLDIMPADQRFLDLLDTEERTPLHYAFLFGRSELVPLLISHNCDPARPDKSGAVPTQRTPFTPEEVQVLLGQGQAMKRALLQRRWRQLAIVFNQKPKAGIEEGVSKRLIENSPHGVAKFLYECEHLQKRLIGDYVGEHHEFNVSVLEAYANLFSFEGLPFDGALRVYLAKFRLPGESQKIERCMENFARRYFAQNPGIFHHEDGVFILAYSTIMLNTDAHNPQVKNKMTKAQFVGTNRGIDDGHDLPREFLEALYDSIVSEGIKMEGEGEILLFQGADRKGWIRKQGGRIKTWKKRWFVLSSNCIYYFKDPEDKEPQGIIPLENLDVRPVNAKRFEFEIFSPQKLASGTEASIKAVKASSSGGGLAKGHHDRYLIAASSQEEMDDWIAAIKSHIVGNPVYLLLQQRTSKKPSSSSSAASSILPPSSPTAAATAATTTATTATTPGGIESASTQNLAVPAPHSRHTMMIPAAPLPSMTSTTIAATSSSLPAAPSSPSSAGSAAAGSSDAASNVNFKELALWSQVCQALRTSSVASLDALFPGCEIVSQTSAPDLSFVLISSPVQKTQTFAIYRHAWDDTEILNRLLQEIKSVDQKDYQIGKIAEHILSSFLRGQLKPDWQLILTGHGLGGCHAVEIYLGLKKQLKITPKLVTFGQPNHTASRSMKKSPLLRVLTETDPVSYLFVGAETSGSELMLLTGEHYTLRTKAAKRAVPRFTPDRGRAAARSHQPTEYHARLTEKIDHSQLVPLLGE